jgi:hypothetical protein
MEVHQSGADTPDDFAPEDQNSDHRPVRADFEVTTSVPAQFLNR